MKPADTMMSGSYAAQAPASAASHSSRVSYSFRRTTNVGIPARSARASPSIPSRSAPTATTWAPYAGSAQASRSAWRLVPEPDTRTTRAAGSERDTRGSLGPAALPPGHGEAADEAADPERGHGVHEHLPRIGSDRGHPTRADGAAGHGGERSEQHAGEHAAGAAAQGAGLPAQRRRAALGQRRAD